MTYPGRTPSFDLQRRAILERHSRYVDLVVEELDAARRSDWRRVRELGAERALLAESDSRGTDVQPVRPKVRRVGAPDLLRELPWSEAAANAPATSNEGAGRSRQPRRHESPQPAGHSAPPPSDVSPHPSAGLDRTAQESTVSSRNLDPVGSEDRMTTSAAEPDTSRDQATRDAQPVGGRTEGGQGDAATTRDRSGQVRNSPETSEMAERTKGELSAERIAEVREKILSGAYNSLDVVDEVARRFLISGDL